MAPSSQELEPPANPGRFTTSTFTDDAIESATRSHKIVLIAMDDLVRWHAEPPHF
ncbi:restriction endonuclease [Bradyrhizobium sp. LCT2]|uniref:restriction endonuclease n=1 Tax=Bradyrhizobium sp. LCT2 TaxID=2493093 RepID=UPI001FEDF834|nr:restriction endonuclease [Bradyrhizobium sp. LCT2]